MLLLRARIVAESLNLKGTPYLWGAKGGQRLTADYLAWAKGPDNIGWRPEWAGSGKPSQWEPSPGGFALDCSGAFGEAIKRAGGPNLDAWHTGRYWQDLPPIGSPLPGDAALYIGHIEMVIGTVDGLVVVGGSSGGDSKTTTLEIASNRRAMYKVKQTHLYRPDFRGFRSIVPFLG